MTVYGFTAAFWDLLASCAFSGAMVGFQIAVVVLIDLIIKRRPKSLMIVFVVVSYLLQGILFGAVLGAAGLFAFHYGGISGLWIWAASLVVVAVVWLRVYSRANGFPLRFRSYPGREPSESETRDSSKDGGQ